MPEAFTISEYYSVCCRPYYAGGDAGSLLDKVRKEYFTGGKTVKGTVRAVENGQEVRTRYRVGANCFHWKKVGGKIVLQEVFMLSNGNYRMVSHDFMGQLLSAVTYDSALHWKQTAYYDGDPAKPAVVLHRENNSLTYLKYDSIAGEYDETTLFPCPWRPGTAAQSYVNGRAGEPQVLARTDAGSFCFCEAEEQKLRLSILERLNQDGDILTPEWPETQKDDGLEFHVIPNDGAAPVAPVPPKQISAAPAVPTPLFSVPEESRKTEDAKAGQAIPQDSDEKSRRAEVTSDFVLDYAANHEIFSVDTPPHAKPDIQQTSESNVPKPAPVSTKYAVAAKGLSGGVIHGSMLKKRNEPTSEAQDDPQQSNLIPAKRIVVSTLESYLYFGKLLDGMRQGQGRTQMSNGHTAYEGGYQNDQRDGFGVYYYKSGKICYVGGWKQNLRSGMGVAFGSKDGSIFVGHWKDDAASGMGTEFDMDGNLTYTGGWKEGRRHGMGTEYRDGQVYRTGLWQEDEFCSGYGRMDGGPEEKAQ